MLSGHYLEGGEPGRGLSGGASGSVLPSFFPMVLGGEEVFAARHPFACQWPWDTQLPLPACGSSSANERAHFVCCLDEQGSGGVGHSGCSGPSCPSPRLGALELTLQSPAVLQTHVATVLVLPPCSVLSVS